MRLLFKTLPPSTNNLYSRARGRVFMKPEVRQAKEALGWEARTQHKGPPLSGPLKVTLGFYWPTARVHDIDNAMKALFDALTGIVWDDDKQITDLSVSKKIDRARPRVELTVEAT